MFKFSTRILIVLLAFNAVAFADEEKEKTLTQYWAETGLTFSTLEKLVNDKACWVDLNSFVGCYNAVRELLSQKSIMILAKSRMHNSPDYIGAQDRDFGAFSTFKFKTPPYVKRTQYEWYMVSKAERQANANSLIALYKAKDKTVAFSAMLAYAKSLAITPENEAQLTGNAINAQMNAAFDPHTHIEPAEAAKKATYKTSETLFKGSTKGIGAYVIDDGHGKAVCFPVKNGPALRDGMFRKDIIVSVDGASVEKMTVDAVKELLQGAANTTVKIGVLRKARRVDLVITRGDVIKSNVEKELLLSASGRFIGYIQLRTFNVRSSCDEVRKAVKEYTYSPLLIEGLIFDMRGNPGGFVDQAICIAGLFLPKDSLVLVEKKLAGRSDDQDDVEMSTEDAPISNLPLVTLIDGHSASASEILAGALHDHGRGVILGARSYGKATIQMGKVFDSNPKINWMLTTSRFYQPNGGTNQLSGILPDIEVYSTPHPTEDEKFTWREEDMYDNALSSQGKPWLQPRPMFVKTLDFCMRQLGKASARYATELEIAPMEPDFAILSAQDALDCTSK